MNTSKKAPYCTYVWARRRRRMWEVWRMKRRKRRMFWRGRRSSHGGRMERAPWSVSGGSRLWVGGPLCHGSQTASRKEKPIKLHFTSYTVSSLSFLRGPIAFRKSPSTRAKSFFPLISPSLLSKAYYLFPVLYFKIRFSMNFSWVLSLKWHTSNKKVDIAVQI